MAWLQTFLGRRAPKTNGNGETRFIVENMERLSHNIQAEHQAMNHQLANIQRALDVLMDRQNRA